MNYRDLSQESFEQALNYYYYLKKRSSISEFEQKQFHLMCNVFLEYFSRWSSNDGAATNAYKVYIRSTPLVKILDLEKYESINWAGSIFTEDVTI